MQHSHPVTRRSFLESSGMAALVAGGAVGLAGCGGSSTPAGTGTEAPPSPAAGSSSGGAKNVANSGSASGGAAGPLPAYKPYQGVKPDLPGTPEGVMQAFFHYPADPQWAISDPPGHGGTVSALVPVITSQLLNPSKNQHWQAINKRLGTTLKVSGNNGSAYTKMVTTRIAGGDLPDVTELTSVPNLPDVLKAKFADLTEYLSGDGIQQYPMLANNPTDAWKTVLYDGRIYGIPATYTSVPNNIIVRSDMFKAAGVDPTITSGDDFMKVSTAMTDIKHNRWAWGQAPSGIVSFIQMMLGVPNQWKVEDGKFSTIWGLDETKQAIDFVRKMWSAGLIEPDSMVQTTKYPTWFAGKRISMTFGAIGSWTSRMTALVAQGLPADTAYGILLPTFAGGGIATYWTRSISLGINALKKASPSRIKEILGVMNWLATPFGTKEYLLKYYGIAGRNYTLDGSDPKPVANVQQQEIMNFVKYYLACEPLVLYTPGAESVVKQQHEFQTKQMPAASRNPTEYLFSNTELSVGPKLSKLILDAMNDVIAGRKSLSSWADAVKQWKSQGGDTVTAEYEKAYAAANS